MIHLSDSAVSRINALTQSGDYQGQMLRLAVNPGGCSGFEYAFSFDTLINTDDVVYEQDGAKLVVDQASLSLLSGSTLNYKNDLMGAMFVVENPNAESGCGCGNSFSA